MQSLKRLTANRANAQRSTGPKSVGGKKRSSMNSLKHGLTAKTLVLRGEDPGEFNLLYAHLVEEFDPRTVVGRELVARIAGLLWRLRRALVFEGSMIEARCAEITPEEVETSDDRFRRQLRIIADRFRAAAAGNDVRSLPPEAEVTKVELKKEPTDRSQLAQRKIGLALTRDGKLLHLLGALARHEGALLNGLTQALQLLFSLRKEQTNTKDADQHISVRRISKRNKVAAEAIVIAGEDPAQFEILCDQLEKEYATHTRMHLELVNYIAGLLWRLRRIPTFEGAMIEALQTEIAPRPTSSSPAEPSNVIGLALIRTSQNDDALGKLSRHEAALMNRVRRSLQLLFASQAV